MPCTGVHHLQGLPVRAGRGPGSPRLPGHPAAARHRLRRPRARALAGGEQDAAGLRSQRPAAAGDLEGAGGVPQARVHSFWPGRGTSGSIYKDDDSFLILIEKRDPSGTDSVPHHRTDGVCDPHVHRPPHANLVA